MNRRIWLALVVSVDAALALACGPAGASSQNQQQEWPAFLAKEWFQAA